MGKVNT